MTSMLREINVLVAGYTEEGIWPLSHAVSIVHESIMFAGALMGYFVLLEQVGAIY